MCVIYNFHSSIHIVIKGFINSFYSLYKEGVVALIRAYAKN